jgi:CheY-like chemotaxis protein
MQQAIEQRKSWTTLSRVAAQGGMRSLHEVGLAWVNEGKTTLAEVERVLGQVVDAEESAEQEGASRILIGDPDENVRGKLRVLLEAEGYEVSEAGDGDEVLRLIGSEAGYHLAILDLDLPGVSGSAVLARLRGSVDTAALPVLMRGTESGEDVQTEILEAGADDYVPRDAGRPLLMARINAVLRRSL